MQTTRLILATWTEQMMRSLAREETRVVCPAAWRQNFPRDNPIAMHR
jgi:hypothetical protein